MTRIAQISDIHWRGLQRHSEYEACFKELFKSLKKEKVDLIVCTGDIFHTKTQNITPEVIDKMVWMFEELAKIAPVHSILGNHDGNLANENRQDAISPLVSAMNNPRIFLYKTSGNRIVDKFNFGVFSCFDKENWNSVVPEEEYVNVALYHGSVLNCLADNGTVMQHGEVNLSMFEGWDFGMFGDIHKTQFLSYRNGKPTIGYPGSLIQQNFGEDEEKGYYIWDIENKDQWDVSFKPIDNPNAMITVDWLGSVQETIEKFVRHREHAGKGTSGVKVRLNADKIISVGELKQIENDLKNIYNVEDFVLKNDSKQQNDMLVTSDVVIQKASLRHEPEALIKLYEQYLAVNSGKFNLTDEQKKRAHELLRSYLKKLNQEETEFARDTVWSIKEMDFSNTYCYGENNKINFQNLSGIVGIFGPNRAGKSSVVGTMMFGLYNTTDRGPAKTAYIINKEKQKASVDVLIGVNGSDYLVRRSAEKSVGRKGVDEEKAAVTLNLYKINQNNDLIDINNENSESRPDTDKVIRSLIGSSNDFLYTAFANQGGLNRFIEEGPTQRKAILNRFLDLGMFEKLSKYSNDDCARLNFKTESLDLTTWESKYYKLNKELVQKVAAASELEIKLNDKEKEISKIASWLLLNSKAIEDVKNINTEKKLAIDKIRTLEQQNLAHEQSITKLHAAVLTLKDKIAELNLNIAGTSEAALEERLANFITLQGDLNSLSSKLTLEKTKLDQINKSVRKLELVPCGDQFKTCHFISDAHLDKEKKEFQEKLVQELFDKKTISEAELLELGKERVAEKLKEYRKIVTSIHEANASLQKAEFSLITEKEKAENIKNMLLSATNRLIELESKSKDLENIRSEIQQYESKEKELNAERFAFNKQKSDLMFEQGALKNEVKKMIEEKESFLRALDDYRVCESVNQSLSKNGIPAFVLKTQLPAINQAIEKILTGVVDFKIVLETEISSNTLDVFIEDKNRRVIELGSGMEKMIASLALRAALIGLTNLPKPDMFIIDEGFGVLDEEGIQKCMHLLSSLKNQFKTVLVISHIPQIKEVADKILEIDTSNPNSRISVQ